MNPLDRQQPFRRSLLAAPLAALLVLAVHGAAPPGIAIEHPKMADGFRGVKLGKPKGEFEGLAFSRSISVPVDFEEEAECRLYTREGENLSYLGAALEQVEYGFVEGRLDRIVAIAKGADAFRVFAADAIERYGIERDPPASFELSWEIDGEVQTETIVINHDAIRHEDSGELEHRWVWGVADSGWLFYELSIRLDETTGQVVLTVSIPMSV